MTSPLWAPSPARAAATRLRAFARTAGGGRDYASLHRWSIERPEEFWSAVWDFCGVVGDRPGPVAVGLERMGPPTPQGPRWFPEAHLNFAENLLRPGGDGPAIIALREDGQRRELDRPALAALAARVASALLTAGVGPGDRVAAYVPNIPEAIAAMLGAASIGAIWSSCSPDFGVAGVVDRFGQIAPRVLLAVDGYRYGGKEIDLRERIAAVRERLPPVAQLVVIPYLSAHPDVGAIPRAVLWDEWLGPGTKSRFTRLPFDHPLYILYSSGTTGLPKCMVHGAGGTLLQHQKEHVLHCDLRPGDRICYYTTTGWMMWNWLASALATGATIVLYDGAPLAPDPRVLWDVVAREGVTVFGTSAKYLALAEKMGLAPLRTHDLTALRALLTTGSPLAGHSYDYVYEHVKRDLHLCNISGGTELISCFALGVPTEPVWRGELQGPGLGMAVDTYDAAGRPVRGEPGELVCTRPFPSMPVAFWNDPDGAKYRAAYFERFPGVWRHGDWAEITDHGGLIIYGRSDATLNPGGVRIGTAELYRVVENQSEVLESLAIGHDTGTGDIRIVLFVKLRDGLRLDDTLAERIRRRLREEASPHHVPWRIIQVADLPRTISGKLSELAVLAVVHGKAVSNVEALANPEALELFRDLPELRT
ncbi:MAG TPA: acetoacetate--CoA ligase [Gemmatimonadales bacterium]|nr:acetoacetate--CoA ligase [Gemmatimonadales bacterium]